MEQAEQEMAEFASLSASTGVSRTYSLTHPDAGTKDEYSLLGPSEMVERWVYHRDGGFVVMDAERAMRDNELQGRFTTANNTLRKTAERACSSK